MKIRLALLGGDQREIVVANTLLKKGFSLKVFGLPREMLCQKEALASSALAAVENADVLLLPVKGVNEEGRVFAPLATGKIFLDENLLSAMAPQGKILCGITSSFLMAQAKKAGIWVEPLMERDAVAVPNAVPTAEGALGIAIERAPMTISGAKIVVLGFGRVGRAVARIFHAVGARVAVVSRNEKEIAEGRKIGYDMRQYRGLPALMPHADVVINTVPALVLNGVSLASLGKNALVIDLASRPGGVDFKAAEELGVPAIHGLGLPGICAPLTAGKIYAEGIIAALAELEREG